MSRSVEVREVLQRSSKRKFYVFIGSKNSKFLAKEVLSSGSVKLYPYKVLESNVIARYKNIVYVESKDDTFPKIGFTKNEAKGFRFTTAQGVEKYFKYVDSLKEIHAISFVSSKSKITNKGVFEISYHDFDLLKRKAKTIKKQSTTEDRHSIKWTLNKIAPKHFESPQLFDYVPGGLSRYIARHKPSSIKLSDDDSSAIHDYALNPDNLSTSALTTKQKIDKIYVEDILRRFKELFSLPKTTAHIEEKWHTFFKEYPWIFTQVFSLPIVFVEDKFNVGGHNLGLGTDKIVDFLYKSKLTNNITFIEIKTHHTPLIMRKVYRPPDIYSASTEITGAMVQVLDQRGQFLKRPELLASEQKIRAINPKCMVIAGNTFSLKEDGQKMSFEYFRSNSRDVEIVTYDEVLSKTKTILRIFNDEETQKKG